jgi:hypothetical protein
MDIAFRLTSRTLYRDVARLDVDLDALGDLELLLGVNVPHSDGDQPVWVVGGGFERFERFERFDD